MDGLLSLFGVLGLIYLADCVFWIREHSWVFTTWFNRKWKEREVVPGAKARETGILLLNPLPPLGRIVCCRLPAFMASPQGVCSLDERGFGLSDASREQNQIFAFAAIRSIQAQDKEIRINEQRFCVGRDPQQAAQTAAWIQTLWKADVQKRENILHYFWDKRFDDAAAQARLAQAARPLKTLRFSCHVLFFYIFLFAPLTLVCFRTTRVLIPLAAGMLALAVRISIGYFKLHKELYPEAREERITDFIMMTACPPAAIRANDTLFRDLLADFHPLVAARLLFSRDQYEKFRLKILRELRHPQKTGNAPDADEMRQWQNQLVLECIMARLPDAAVDAEQSEHMPLPASPAARAYCPRCLAQFTRSTGDCSDCAGVSLAPFNKNEILQSEDERHGKNFR